MMLLRLLGKNVVEAHQLMLLLCTSIYIVCNDVGGKSNDSDSESRKDVAKHDPI